MGIRLGDLNVHGRQNREHVRLNKRDDKLNRVDDEQNENPSHAGKRTHRVHGGEMREQGLGEDARHDGERTHDDVSGEHIAEQTNGKRHQTEQERKDLDNPHEDVHGERNTCRGKALEVAEKTVLLHTEIQEVDKGNQGDGSSTAYCARAGLHAGHQADEVVDQNEEEQRRQKWEVLAPIGADNALGDIILNILDDPLDAIYEKAFGSQRLLFHKCENNSQKHNTRDEQPKRILGETNIQIADNRRRGELGNELCNCIWELGERVQDSTFLMPPGTPGDSFLLGRDDEERDHNRAGE